MELQTLLTTEWRLLEPLCEFTYTDDYAVYKSVRFPHFYGANGIDIRHNAGRGLAEWEAVFDGYFEKSLYGHKAFTFIKNDELSFLEEEARAANYDVVRTSSFMAAPSLPWEGIRQDVRRIETEQDWKKYSALYHDDNREAGWYTPNACDNLFEKMRYMTKAVDIHWLYLPGNTSEMIGALIGVFQHNGLARLQDVVTHPACRRRGLASGLLRYIMAYAGEHLRAETVVLCADTDYFAIDFYRKAGFVPVGETVELMKYAVRRSP